MLRVTISLLFAALGIGVGLTSIHSAGATIALSCLDKRDNTLHAATKFLTSPGTLNGTSGDDVLVGSAGSDVIDGKGGNDIICSQPSWSPNFDFADTINGGSGNDSIFGYANVHGDAGNDYLWVLGNGKTAFGDSGNDTIFVSQAAIGDGGSGNDWVQSTDLGQATKLLGGSGNDVVYNGTFTPLIDCGSNVDQVYANGATTVLNCENQFKGN